MLNERLKDNEDGYGLIFLLMLILSIGIIVPLIARSTINELLISRNHSIALRDHYLLEGGVKVALNEAQESLEGLVSKKNYLEVDDLLEVEAKGSVEVDVGGEDGIKISYSLKEIVDEGSKLNINKASKGELMKINGIGDVISEGIIDKRPFKSLDWLTKVGGIGELDSATYSRLKGYLTVNSDGRININTASKEVLKSLEGVGDSLAENIVSARPFQKIEEILEIDSLGDKRYQNIKDDIRVNSKDFSLLIEVKVDGRSVKEEVEFLHLDQRLIRGANL